MEAYFKKLPNGALVPDSEEDQELLAKLKVGEPVRLKLTRARNHAFHRKYMALLRFAFDYWEPPELEVDAEEKWKKKVTPEKNFDRFRKDVAILAGFYDAHFRLNGETRIEAKSISFASMTEDEFEDLYSKTIDVVLKHVCTQYTDQMLRDVVDQTLEFAA